MITSKVRRNQNILKTLKYNEKKRKNKMKATKKFMFEHDANI